MRTGHRQRCRQNGNQACRELAAAPALRTEGLHPTVATKAIVGEKVGMTQVWDEQQPRHTGDGAQGRARARGAGEDARARGVLRPAGDLGRAPGRRR